ncbi:hypothetical protein [Clostridium botulinum]|uniref:Uncharacterized protein n=1 Tax=Clostridium botulinum TaxID=1491 RepID=A0ABD7CGM2_CLOBO|nr:hypothetical protein [Clostridium botulinum]KGO13814.1 hypothetical protein NZ45_10365 [Clostridium botulinum]KIN81878.1 hypothetical protein SD74_08055 [Clostridium botulinum]MCC5425577.1 hypothetical protein [Clostridium botulinum]QRI52186.1 hypothetical protein JQS73_12130 [Clostridium botulinum]
MEDIKVTVTQEKREETIDRILELVEKEFKGLDVTAVFTKKLLEDTIKVLEYKCMETSLKSINKNNFNK